MTTFVAKAPGKLILVGEHAAVYGHPAVTTAVGLWATAIFEPAAAADAQLTVDLPDLNLAFEEDPEALRVYAAAAQRAWRESTMERTSTEQRHANSGDASHLARIACGEVIARLVEQGVSRFPRGRLEVRSEIPLGAGFGSSAATASAIIGALLAAAGFEPTAAAIEPIALEVERRQHGTPSGIDHNTVLRGGTLVARLNGGPKREYQPVAVPAGAFDPLRIFDTGTPAEPTGRVVSVVKKRRREDPEAVDDLLIKMGGLVDRVIRALPGGKLSFSEVFREYEACLEGIGVVPTSVQRTIRAIEESGGGAKISGAGCHTGNSAGCLLVSGVEAVAASSGLEAYQRVDAELGVHGLRVDVR